MFPHGEFNVEPLVCYLESKLSANGNGVKTHATTA